MAGGVERREGEAMPCQGGGEGAGRDEAEAEAAAAEWRQSEVMMDRSMFAAGNITCRYLPDDRGAGDCSLVQVVSDHSLLLPHRD